MERRDGFLTFFVDREGGRIWLRLPPPGAGGTVAEALYLEGLEQGLGSNPIGLDRGQLGEARLIRIRRIGPKVLFEQPNLRFRADGAAEAERRATAESFATSVLWGGEIGALDEADGTALVDLTSFLVRDARGVVRTLAETEQGEFELDDGRSAVLLDDCLAFPDNLELAALLTFAGSEPGEHVRATVPTPEAITLVQHHALIRLPDDGYRPRRFDPRIGMFGIDYQDYAVPLDRAIVQRFIARHRLEKVDPSAARSPVREPIVYHVDRGAPEPVRGALLDGARWWAEAFERAGFIDAFRVELMPEGAHPLDVRYNVIQWVHRSTRGWSYGNAVVDPRTGEIVKGHVSLGSLRVRQDRLLFEGLAGTEATGTGAGDDPVELALARIRQLSAHEVGHTLGITHNFAASTYGDRASVMDYPAPLIAIDADQRFDFSAAYGVGLGSWDIHTVRYGYAQEPDGGDEAAMLAAIVRDGLEAGLIFLTDDDARPASAADPRANLWDNGADPVAALEHALRVRALALERFGETNVHAGTPLAELEEVLAPVYFHHRYQVDAAAKVIGGMEYSYAVRDDGQTPALIVDAARQRRALEVLLSVLDPATLDLPERLLALLVPRPFGFERNREMFATGTWPAFDALGAAATAADQVIATVLEPQRMARIEDFARRHPTLPGLEEILATTVDQVFAAPPADEAPRRAALRRTVQRVLADRLMALAGGAVGEGDGEGEGDGGAKAVDPAVRAHLESALRAVAARLDAPAAAGAPHARTLVADIERFFGRVLLASPKVSPLPSPPPPGSPIGLPAILAGCAEGPW